VRDRFLHVGETMYRKRRGILIFRDCIVGHIPKYLWPRIEGRKKFRKRPKVARHELEF
jgi:hypothetical protein